MDLKKAIQHLPDYEPRADLWTRIETDLTADGLIDGTLEKLPQFEPAADAWDHIAVRLETPVKPLGTRSFGWLVTVSVAAAIALLVGTWLIFRQSSAEEVTIAYAVEPVQPLLTPPAPADPAAEQRAEEFINQQCERQVIACQKPEVNELKHQLAELNHRKSAVEQELNVFGNDPALVQAQIKIENQRAEVTKELVRLLLI